MSGELNQPGLWDASEIAPWEEPRRPRELGGAFISYAPTAKLLTKASGFMSSYDYTLNPYSGCAFGCTYCYAAFFVRDQELQDRWGSWVTVKENALEKLRSMRTDLSGRSIYMSSVTDPYQPIERHLGLVRSILEELATRQVRLVIQTRSPLATRDIDLFSRFEHLRVNMTITTDDDRVRRTFEPAAPSTKLRLDAIRAVAAAGIATSITLTPLLPILDPTAFAQRLLETGVPSYVVQNFHPTKGSFVRGTGLEALDLLRDLQWDASSYEQAVQELRKVLGRKLLEGKAGFAPA